MLRDADNLPFVYVQVKPGTFARRHVKLGDQIGDSYAIERRARTTATQVLTDGALFVQFADSLEHVMIHKLIRIALRQKFVILALALATLVGGVWAFHALPVDAYPDLSPPKVEIITQWQGHAVRGGRAPDHDPARDRVQRRARARRRCARSRCTACPTSS